MLPPSVVPKTSTRRRVAMPPREKDDPTQPQEDTEVVVEIPHANATSADDAATEEVDSEEQRRKTAEEIEAAERVKAVWMSPLYIRLPLERIEILVALIFSISSITVIWELLSFILSFVGSGGTEQATHSSRILAYLGVSNIFIALFVRTNNEWVQKRLWNSPSSRNLIHEQVIFGCGFACILLHGVFEMSIGQVAFGNDVMNLDMTGLLAWCLLFLYACWYGFAILRLFFYHTFHRVQVVLMLLIIIFVSAHSVFCLSLLMIWIAWLMVDYGRIAFLIWNQQTAHIVQFVELPGELLEIELDVYNTSKIPAWLRCDPLPLSSAFGPGRYIRLRFPEISKLEFHSFYISSSEPRFDIQGQWVCSRLLLHMRVEGDWTDKVYQMGLDWIEDTRVYMEQVTERNKLVAQLMQAALEEKSRQQRKQQNRWARQQRQEEEEHRRRRRQRRRLSAGQEDEEDDQEEEQEEHKHQDMEEEIDEQQDELEEEEEEEEISKVLSDKTPFPAEVEGPLMPIVNVSGPFSWSMLPDPIEKYHSVLFITGGRGVSALQPFFNDWLQSRETQKEEGIGEFARFCWSARESDVILDRFKGIATMDQLRVLHFQPPLFQWELIKQLQEDEMNNVGVDFYLTDLHTFHSVAYRESVPPNDTGEYPLDLPPPSCLRLLHGGDGMRVAAIIHNAVLSASATNDQKLAILVSGPPSLIDDVKAVVLLHQYGGMQIDLHVQRFAD